MWSTSFLLFLLPLPILGQSQNHTQRLIVNLGYVTYAGTYNSTSDINAWFGIHYAQAPVGELRWRAPVDIETKNNYTATRTTDASQPGPSCMQGYPFWYPVRLPAGDKEHEDCLVLDVLAPAKPVSSALPVMVQIHGGGYVQGSSQPGDGKLSALTSNPGNALVYQSGGNLIYVTIQYRLGGYGFLGGPEVLENGATNAGLLDQRAALTWVQRHIGRFGGDPAKVTVIGGSAGGGSIINHMIMYSGVANPPFRAALAEYPWMQPYHNASTLSRQYTTLLQASNCTTLTCLRSLPSSQLRTAIDNTYETAYQAKIYGYGDYFYGPSLDGNTIPTLPSKAFALGHFTKVPFLTSREGFEGTSFTNRSLTNDSNILSDLQTVFSSAKQFFFTRLFQLYPRTASNSTFSQRAQIFGDAIITCPSSRFAAAVSDYGLPAWKMIFNAGSQQHGALLPYVETLNLEGNSDNATLASIMRNYYISFATSLDPNGVRFTNASHPVWPRYQTAGSAGFQVLNVTDKRVGVSGDLDARAECDFLGGQGEVVRN